jgi:hypothetical protein
VINIHKILNRGLCLRGQLGADFLFTSKPSSEVSIWTLPCKDIYDCQGIYNLEGIYCSRDGSGWFWGSSKKKKEKRKNI